MCLIMAVRDRGGALAFRDDRGRHDGHVHCQRPSFLMATDIGSAASQPETSGHQGDPHVIQTLQVRAHDIVLAPHTMN
jgi:hypothetical protein